MSEWNDFDFEDEHQQPNPEDPDLLVGEWL